ncbi:MAG: methionyl-tRNA formyltransferase [Planctomycetes bacterium]|nr:methionyl-tRNA formyltransferase [Planctomycetota bacterium]
MRILFFGSSDFAIPSLKALSAGGHAPALVVTKPDAPRGRGRKIYDAELKLAAQELDLPFAQPVDPHAPDFLQELRKLEPDLGIVVSYGVILTPEMLALPKHGMINAHASLLPKYRGAAPIQRCMRDGCQETGVTIMRIVQQLDAGDVLLTKKTPIDPKENSGALRTRLAELSGPALLEAIELIGAGKAKYTPQDHSQASYAPKVEKPDGLIDWSLPAVEIDLLVRSMTPKPGAQTRLGNKRFIVMEGTVEPDVYGMGIPGALQSSGEEGIRVCTGKDLYRITRIKPDNGRNMTAGEWVRGHHVAPDARFG